MGSKACVHGTRIRLQTWDYHGLRCTREDLRRRTFSRSSNFCITRTFYVFSSQSIRLGTVGIRAILVLFCPELIGCCAETRRQRCDHPHGSEHPGFFPVHQQPEPIPLGAEGPDVPVLSAQLVLQAQPGPQQPAAGGDPPRHQRHPEPFHGGHGLHGHDHHAAVGVLHRGRVWPPCQ